MPRTGLRFLTVKHSALLTLALLSFLLSTAVGDDDKTGYGIRGFVGAGGFIKPYLPGGERQSEEPSAVRINPKSDRPELYDVKSVIVTHSGMALSAEFEAVFDRIDEVLVVRGTTNDIDLMDRFMLGIWCGNPVAIQIGLSTYRLAPGSDPNQQPEAIRSSPKNRQLAGMMINSKSGQRVEGRAVHLGADLPEKYAPVNEENQGDRFRPDEYGIEVDLESILDADGRTVDLNYVYSIRLEPEQIPALRHVQELRNTGSVSVPAGEPRIVQTVTIPVKDSEPVVIAVILDVRLVIPRDLRLEPPTNAQPGAESAQK